MVLVGSQAANRLLLLPCLLLGVLHSDRRHRYCVEYLVIIVAVLLIADINF